MGQKKQYDHFDHTGGTSIPGSDTVTAEQVIATDPDVACHVNGGPTAMSSDEIRKLINDTKYTIELVHCGNPKALLDAVNMGLDSKALSRFIIGNDAPSGTGVIPLGILRVICTGSVAVCWALEQAICMATGNTARVFKLNTGVPRNAKRLFAHQPRHALVVDDHAAAEQLALDPSIAIMAILKRDAVNEIAQVCILARRPMRAAAAIVAGARNLGERAQAANVGVIMSKALRLFRDHFLDDRVEAGATSFGVVASQSRKASRKKWRSAC